MTAAEVMDLVVKGLTLGSYSPTCTAMQVDPMHVRINVMESTALRHVEGVARWLTDQVPLDLCVDIVASSGAARVYGDRWCQARVLDGRVVSTHAPQFNGVAP